MAADASHPYRPAGGLVADPLGAYAGPWNARLAAHLLRRAGFGGTPPEVDALARGSMAQAVGGLVRFASTAALPQPPDTSLPAPGMTFASAEPATMPTAMTGTGTAEPSISPLVAARKSRRKIERRQIAELQRWWLDRMTASPAPLQEKMTLFWHGHFTTAAIQKNVTPAEILGQNQLFRTNALGNARRLTLAVAMDPAMLKYLDNAKNGASHPNENFARELMELYTLGIGNYTERDVREAARAWTGLRVKRGADDVTLVGRMHDSGSKTFLGNTGNLGGSDVVETIFRQPAAARFFASKLLGYFVYADPEPELVDAVAARLRAHDFELAPVVATLLSSNVFYSTRAYRALVKSPVEFVVGTHRALGIAHATPETVAALKTMTQVLFHPPNVKGWPGGASWINSSTMLARENFVNALTTAKSVGDAPWLYGSGPGDPHAAAATLVDGFVQGDASAAGVSRLVAYLAGSQSAVDGALSAENFDERVRGGAYLTMAMPAYQLA